MENIKKLSLKPVEYKKIKKDLELFLVDKFHPGSLIMNTYILNFEFHNVNPRNILTNFGDRPIKAKIQEITNFFVNHPLLRKYIQKNQEEWIKKQNDFMISIIDSLARDGVIDKIKRTYEKNKKHLNNTMSVDSWFASDISQNSFDFFEYKMNIEAFLSSNDNYIFYAREFTQKTLNIYNEVEQTINETFNLETVMLENSGQAGNIHNYMFNKIKQCKFMIADLSGYKVCEECKDKICNHINNNVIYEIGLAHGLGKSVIIIVDSKKDLLAKNNSEDLPFDINSHTVIQYNMDNFKQSLEGVISTTLENI